MNQGKSGRTEPHYYSDKLKQKLDKLRYAPTTVVEAPSGYGKTTAIRDYFKDGLPQGTPVYWFTAADEAFASGFRRLCREIEKIDRNAGECLLKIESLNAVTIGEAMDAIRSIRCTYEAYLIIDNFQLLQDLLPPALFTALFEHGGEGLHIIFVTQMLKRNMAAVITGQGYFHIGTADLRLSAEDICRYYALASVNITMKDAQDIERCTEGWIIAVYLQLRAFRETGKFSDTVGILALMESMVWDKLTVDQKTFLLYLSPFEMVTIQQACAIIGSSTLPEYALNALASPFIHYDPVEQRYESHSILANLIIQKRRERGVVFERECLLQAGDFFRNDGKIAEALDFYARIRDYDRMLSLDLSNMTLKKINNIPYAQLALDIACNCPTDIKRRHILSMLQVTWALCMAGMKEQYDVLMDELYSMPELQENSNLLGEWMLLYSYKSFPNIVEMTDILNQAAPLFKGKCSKVILSSSPWCFGGYSYMTAFHAHAGEAEQEADDLEKYISIYSRLTNGHGSGADVSFRAELAYHRGDISEAEILCYKAIFIAESNRQNIVQIGVAMYLAEIALHKGDVLGWQNAIGSMERAAISPAQDTFVSRGTLDIVRGILLNELANQNSIADWLKTTDFGGHPILMPMVDNAMFVHLSFLMQQGEHSRIIGIGEAIQKKDGLRSSFQEAFIALIMAVSYKAMNNYAQAAAMVERAVELLLSDGLVFPLATYSWSIGEMVGEIIERKYPQLLGKFNTVRERFAIGWDKLHNAMFHDKLPADLTVREYEVAMLAAEGLRNSEIAEKLMVTESTVRTHLRTIFQKLDIDRRTRLAEKLK